MPFSLDKTQKAVINKISVDVNSVLDIGSGEAIFSILLKSNFQTLLFQPAIILIVLLKRQTVISKLSI